MESEVVVLVVVVARRPPRRPARCVVVGGRAHPTARAGTFSTERTADLLCSGPGVKVAV